MFASFERTQDLGTARRMGASLLTSALICAGLLAGAMAFRGAEALAVKEKKVDVTFRPPPPAKPIELPPPPAPKVAKVAPRPAAPAAMVAPKEVPPKPVEAKPVETPVAAKEIAVGGTGDGSSGKAVAKVEAPPAEEPEEEAKPVATNGPVTLPEDAEPPEELDGNERPEFPESARANGVEGLVILKIVVEKDGSVGKIQVMKGEEPFVAAALAVVKGWKYSPATLDDQPLAVFRIVKIPFRLKT